MKQLLMFIAVFVCAILPPSMEALGADPALELPPLILGQGEQRLLRVPGLDRYALGSDQVRAHPIPSHIPGSTDTILLKGVERGTTDLWVWKKDKSAEHRTIRVEKWSNESTNPKLERALSQLQEVEVLFSGPGVIIRGKIRTLQECAKIDALLNGFPKEILNETEVDETLLNQKFGELQNWIKKAGKSDQIRIEKNDNSLWVRGVLGRPTERASIERQARAIFPLAQFELDALPDASPTVHFRVFLLEIRKNRFHSLGLTWPPGQANAFQVTSWGIKESLQLDVALQALEGEGSAKILSNPELVVRAPGEAELFAGGELPIHNKSHYSSNISWKPFGLTLKLKVTHVAGEKVRLEILTEVSHLDREITADATPGLRANRMKTQVDARFGTPLFLSGLLQEGAHEQARGLPLLRQIPILGGLFGSEDFQSERSELVAILLPQSAPPPAPLDRMRPTSAKLSPPPRNWLSAEQERQLKNSPDYPWNALQ